MKAPFHTYTFKQQALSINGRIADLRRAINAHARRADSIGKDGKAIKEKCVGQVQRMLATISLVLVLLLSGCGDVAKQSPAESRRAMAVKMTTYNHQFSTAGADDQTLRIESGQFIDESLAAAIATKFKHNEVLYDGKDMCAMGFKEVDILYPHFDDKGVDTPKTEYQITLPCAAQQ